MEVIILKDKDKCIYCGKESLSLLVCEECQESHNFEFELIVNGQCVDTTSLDTNEPEHAMELFMDEFGWDKKLNPHEKDQAYVRLSIGWRILNDNDYDNPEIDVNDHYAFVPCFMIHPKEFNACYAYFSDPEKVCELECCKYFEREWDWDEETNYVMCGYCNISDSKGTCERALIVTND